MSKEEKIDKEKIYTLIFIIFLVVMFILLAFNLSFKEYIVPEEFEMQNIEKGEGNID